MYMDGIEIDGDMRFQAIVLYRLGNCIYCMDKNQRRLHTYMHTYIHYMAIPT